MAMARCQSFVSIAERLSVRGCPASVRCVSAASVGVPEAQTRIACPGLCWVFKLVRRLSGRWNCATRIHNFVCSSWSRDEVRHWHRQLEQQTQARRPGPGTPGPGSPSPGLRHRKPKVDSLDLISALQLPLPVAATARVHLQARRRRRRAGGHWQAAAAAPATGTAAGAVTGGGSLSLRLDQAADSEAQGRPGRAASLSLSVTRSAIECAVPVLPGPLPVASHVQVITCTTMLMSNLNCSQLR